jgi:tRNA-dihydrouridine synthase
MNWIDSFTSENKPIVALAPMDGYCDSAFRAVCQKVAGWDIVVFSEFYSADGLHHNPILAKRVLYMTLSNTLSYFRYLEILLRYFSQLVK